MSMAKTVDKSEEIQSNNNRKELNKLGKIDYIIGFILTIGFTSLAIGIYEGFGNILMSSIMGIIILVLIISIPEIKSKILQLLLWIIIVAFLSGGFIFSNPFIPWGSSYTELSFIFSRTFGLSYIIGGYLFIFVKDHNKIIDDSDT